MVHTALTVFIMIMKFLMIPIFAVLAVCLVFYLDCMFWYLLRLSRGDRIQSGSVRKLPKRSALLRIFYDAPRQYVADIYDRKPDFFRPQGLVIFTGRQGNGKSIAMMQYALELHDTYPLCKILSNTAFA